MIFDTHCHLDPNTADAVIARATAAGVTRMLAVGIDLESSRTAHELRATHAAVCCSVGLHPNAADRFDAEWPALQDLARSPTCTAIGETGLDYHWDDATPTQQKRAMAAHLALAKDLDKPVIIHCREAHEDTYDELAEAPGVRGVIHCFSGGIPAARRALDLGYYLSFAGPLTYKNADALREAAAFAPADRILVETDAPFLSPQPKRGEVNEPANVVHTVRRLAEVRGIEFEATAELTFANAVRLFGRAVGVPGVV